MCAEVRLVAEALSEKDALALECERIAFWRSTGSVDLCNVTDGGEGVSGLRHSKESKEKMAAKARGKVASEETRQKMRESSTGKRHTPEARTKLSASKTGKPQGPHTPEHNAKIGAAAKGRKDPEEVKEKKRIAALNRPPQSEEVRARIAEKVRLLWADPAYRAKLVHSHENRAPTSEEAKENMCLAQRARRAAEKQGA
jgi:hypothetical protein